MDTKGLPPRWDGRLEPENVWLVSQKELTDLTTQETAANLRPYFHTAEGQRIPGKHMSDIAHLLLSEQIERHLR